MFGRKFMGCVIGTVTVLIIYLCTLFVYPTAVDVKVHIIAILMMVTIWFAYIGGNVWNKWVKSKYFNQNILDGEDK